MLSTRATFDVDRAQALGDHPRRLLGAGADVGLEHRGVAIDQNALVGKTRDGTGLALVAAGRTMTWSSLRTWYLLLP